MAISGCLLWVCIHTLPATMLQTTDYFYKASLSPPTTRPLAACTLRSPQLHLHSDVSNNAADYRLLLQGFLSPPSSRLHAPRPAARSVTSNHTPRFDVNHIATGCKSLIAPSLRMLRFISPPPSGAARPQVSGL